MFGSATYLGILPCASLNGLSSEGVGSWKREALSLFPFRVGNRSSFSNQYHLAKPTLMLSLVTKGLGCHVRVRIWDFPGEASFSQTSSAFNVILSFFLSPGGKCDSSAHFTAVNGSSLCVVTLSLNSCPTVLNI